MVTKVELSKQFDGNELYMGDNLELVQQLPVSYMDLIYLDPPFFAKRDFSNVSNADKEIREFSDTWKNLNEYLKFLFVRLNRMKMLLKPTGSICVHLDWHAVHYVKVYMDRLFGYDNFRNEIIWCYSGANVATMCFPKKHDTILWYSRSKDYTFNPQDVLIERTSDWDIGKVGTEDIDGNMYTIKYGKKVIMRNEYSLRGKIPEDWWQISIIPPTSEERMYPTQKPYSLIERLVKALSNSGDIVGDFFSGGGTTLLASQKLGRKWIGCDKNPQAIEVIKARLLGNKSVKDKDYQGNIESAWRI